MKANAGDSRRPGKQFNWIANWFERIISQRKSTQIRGKRTDRFCTNSFGRFFRKPMRTSAHGTRSIRGLVAQSSCPPEITGCREKLAFSIQRFSVEKARESQRNPADPPKKFLRESRPLSSRATCLTTGGQREQRPVSGGNHVGRRPRSQLPC